MEHFGITMSLIGLIFIAIIGVYVWTFKVYKDTKNSLSDVYKTVNGHIQDNQVHVGNDGYIPVKVCEALHTSLKENVVEIKMNVQKILDKI